MGLKDASYYLMSPLMIVIYVIAIVCIVVGILILVPGYRYHKDLDDNYLNTTCWVDSYRMMNHDCTGIYGVYPCMYANMSIHFYDYNATRHNFTKNTVPSVSNTTVIDRVQSYNDTNCWYNQYDFKCTYTNPNPKGHIIAGCILIIVPIVIFVVGILILVFTTRKRSDYQPI